jgi:L-malate glycosyltransferase
MNKPIKIMFLIAGGYIDGSNKALLNLLEILIVKGVKPLVVMSGSGGIDEILKTRGIPYLQVQYDYSIYPPFKSFRDFILFVPILLRTIIYNIIAKNKLVRIARKHEIDIIHTNVSPLHIGYHVAKKLNIPHVWHVREYQELSLGWHPLFSRNTFIKKLNSKKCYPIAITEGIRRHYSMKGNARVIYDGVLKASQIQFIQQKEKYFLFAGRLEEAKGIKELIDTFIEFAKQNSDYKLLIAGDGTEKYKSLLMRAVNNDQMNDRIKFLGFRNDVSDLMSRATAIVIPSTFEGFGFTTAEAMFNGCLVIGKNSGGTIEILENESYGILYNNQSELVNILHGVVNKGIAEFFPIIIKAREKASRFYSCEKHGEKVFALYKEILADKKSI